MPASRAICWTVRGLSPEITRIVTPCRCKKSTVSTTPWRRELRKITAPIAIPEPSFKSFILVFSSANSASINTRRPLSAQSFNFFRVSLSTGANFDTNSGAPIIKVRTVPLILALTPAILRADENAITSIISVSFGGAASARIARPVIFPPLVSWAIKAAKLATSELEKSSPNDATFSSDTSSLVRVPVLSTASKFSSAIASIADNFCGKTFAWASRNEPNASSNELANNNPSGTTVTAAEVIVFKIITTLSPEK